MYVAAGMWDDAALLAAGNAALAPVVYLPYARFLSDQRRLDEAREAFRCNTATLPHPSEPQELSLCLSAATSIRCAGLEAHILRVPNESLERPI